MNLIASVLAVYRLTSLVTKDELTEPIRARVALAATGKPVGSLVERASYLVSCHRCVSVWAGAAVLLLSRFAAGRVLIAVLALSGTEIALRAVADKVAGDE